MAERLQSAIAATAAITVPATLRRPHPAIAAWIAERERKIAEDKRDRWRFGSNYQTKPFTELERREQRFLNTLYKELEKRGFKVRGQAPHTVSVEIGRDKVEFTLRERIRQVRRPLNDQEKASEFYRHQQWRQESVPTGELTFTIKTQLDRGLTQKWRDGERRLEEQIAEIVAVLSLSGPILAERRRVADEEERRRWEDERKRSEEREKQRLEQNRWRKFLELARNWERARLVSDFIEALQQLSPDTEYTYGGQTSEEWLARAREQGDQYDPTRWAIGDVCLKLAEVTFWQQATSEYD